jgi:hypothetical protein
MAVDEFTLARVRKHLDDGGVLYARVATDDGVTLTEGLLNKDGSIPPHGDYGWPVKRTGIATRFELTFEGKVYSSGFPTNEPILSGQWAKLGALEDVAVSNLEHGGRPKRSLDDRFDDWLVKHFSWRVVRPRLKAWIDEQVFSRWDFFFGLFVVAGSIGPRKWTLLPIGLVWIVGRVWAAR